jgi:NADH-quinone oxidoreductase subunit L
VAGVLLARHLYARGPSPAARAFAQRFSLAYTLSHGKYFVDEIYEAIIVRPARGLARLFYGLGDRILVDGILLGALVGLISGIGNTVRTFHNGDVRRHLMAMLVGLGLVLGYVYFNREVAVLGPTAVHPVDLGGLSPQMGGRVRGRGTSTSTSNRSGVER